jgi:carbamoyl-phosphate synthase large subunit
VVEYQLLSFAERDGKVPAQYTLHLCSRASNAWWGELLSFAEQEGTGKSPVVEYQLLSFAEQRGTGKFPHNTRFISVPARVTRGGVNCSASLSKRGRESPLYYVPFTNGTRNSGSVPRCYVAPPTTARNPEHRVGAVSAIVRCMTLPKILVTGAGGAAGVVCIKSLIGRAIVYAVDMSPLSPGLFLVPAEQRALVPAGAAPGFGAQLLELCDRWQIDIVIPTVDAELVPCAELKADLAKAGTLVLVSDTTPLAKCLDKYILAKALRDTVPLPRTELANRVDPSTWQLPLICKPRTGSGSRGIALIENAADLLPLLDREDILLQEHLPGAEYSVDVLVGDYGGIVAVVRERMRTDSGIAIVAKVVRDPEIETHALAAAAEIGLFGIVNVQFKRDVHGKPKLLEINPRPPGTLALSIAAGADMVMWSINLLLGLPIPLIPEITELAMVRTWQEQYIAPNDLERLAPSSMGEMIEVAS